MHEPITNDEERSSPTTPVVCEWHLNKQRAIFVHVFSALLLAVGLWLFYQIALHLPVLVDDYSPLAGTPVSSTVLICALSGIFILLILLVTLHELFHGVGFRILGAKPIYGWKPFSRVPVIYTSAPGFQASRNGFLMMALLPTVAVNALGIAAMYPSTLLRVLLVFPLAVHFSGCIVDWMMTAFLLKLPADTRVEDTLDGFRYTVKMESSAL